LVVGGGVLVGALQLWVARFDSEIPDGRVYPAVSQLKVGSQAVCVEFGVEVAVPAAAPDPKVSGAPQVVHIPAPIIGL
jgi:hypothetical protein